MSVKRLQVIERSWPSPSPAVLRFINVREKNSLQLNSYPEQGRITPISHFKKEKEWPL